MPTDAVNADSNQSDALESNPAQESPRAFSLGAIVIAGLFGGPIAFWFLVQRNFVMLGLREGAKLGIVLFVLAMVSWFYICQHTPNDLLSKLLSLMPQLLLWCIAARYLLGKSLSEYQATGGCFRSKWIAFGVGVITQTLTIIVYYGFSLLSHNTTFI
jgi:hypothetical protein